MYSPGEQPSTQPVKLSRVVFLIFVCAAFTALLWSQAAHLNEYRLYFKDNRKPAFLDLATLSEDWTENRVKEQFADYPVTCVPYRGPLAVQRACAVDVNSANGIPALYLSFFFAEGSLDQVAINIPWWIHGTAYEWLVGTFGAPAASQFIPSNGVRLHGWRLKSGAAVFFNRDRSSNPLQWNGIYWRSASACKSQGCFIK